MKKLIYYTSAFLMLLLISFAPTSSTKYQSEDGILSAIFPSDFKVSKEEKDGVSNIKIQSEKENQIYFIAYGTFNMKFDNHDELAQVSVDAFAESLDAKVTKKEVWKYKGYNGIHAWLESESNGLVGEYKVILIGQRQFQITSMAYTNDWTQKEVGKFFKSFKLSKEIL